jgi:tripartite-type tricarboxylate transporter receptor subunit TctC
MHMGAFLKSLLAALCVAFALPAAAQDYPNKPIRMMVGFPPGGTNDILARVIAQRLSDALGQPVVVDNRPGATGVIAAEMVARAAPDGHTLLLGSTGSQTIVPALQKLPYDPINDLQPVSLVGVAGLVLCVNPNVPANSVRELVELARSKPGQLTYASSGNGSTLHFGGELFKVLAGVHIVHIPYKGNAPALTDVMGGQVDMTFSAVPPALPHAKAGKLRMLGVSTVKRMHGLEDVPTIAEAGVPGYEMSTWYGVFAPGGMPAAITDRLAAEVAKAINEPQVRDQFLAQSVEPRANTPVEFRKLVNDEIANWTKLVKSSGIRAD